MHQEYVTFAGTTQIAYGNGGVFVVSSPRESGDLANVIALPDKKTASSRMLLWYHKTRCCCRRSHSADPAGKSVPVGSMRGLVIRSIGKRAILGKFGRK